MPTKPSIANYGAESAPKVKTAEVQEAMSELEHQVEQLRLRTINLVDRLEPVMSPPRPLAAGEACLAHSDVPLAGKIQDHTSTIVQAIDRLDDIMARLEV